MRLSMSNSNPIDHFRFSTACQNMASPPKRPRSRRPQSASPLLHSRFFPSLPLAFASWLHPLPCKPSPLPSVTHHSSPRFIIACTAKPPKSAPTPQLRKSTPTHASVPTDPPEPAAIGLSLLLLNFVTVLWGTQHAVIKIAIQHTPPATLNLSRFLLAALISLPSLPKPSAATRQSYLAATELSLYLFLGYALQSVSLLTTSASRSGFLLYLNVKLVPLFARGLYGRRISALTWGSAALALFGTGLLTYDGTPPAIGDVWSILAAAASAMFILRLESAAVHPPKEINAISLTSVSILCAIWSFTTHPATSPSDMLELLPTSPTGIAAVLYLGIATTALSNYLQTLGQRHVPAERAAVIFAMDPVYGAFFASALLGESLGGRGIAGAACIAVAAILSNSENGSWIVEGVQKLGRWVRQGVSDPKEPSRRE